MTAELCAIVFEVSTLKDADAARAAITEHVRHAGRVLLHHLHETGAAT